VKLKIMLIVNEIIFLCYFTIVIQLLGFDFFFIYFDNSAISWRPVLVVEEAGVHEENHRPWASNW
jgi:hypothetical protein